MFGLGGTEIAIILIFGFLIFGPDKLPGIARTVGRVIRQFRNAQAEVNRVIKTEVYDPIKDLEPLVNPFAGLSLDGLTKDTDETVGQTDAVTGPLSEGGAAEAGGEKAKPSPDQLKAAVRREAEKSRQKAEKAAAAGAAAVGVCAADTAEGATIATADVAEKASKESFAERRARLEREHAERVSSERREAESGATKASDSE